MEKLNRDEFIEEIKEIYSQGARDEEFWGEFNILLNRLWWTAINQGARIEAVEGKVKEQMEAHRLSEA